MIEYKNVNKSYGNQDIIKNLNLKIEDGTFLTVVGTSGSGDSDIMMTDTINPLKSKFKGFHKTFKQDDLGLSLSSFLLN
ncbi:hypothetical protein [Streptococcus anginosus]|uniref:hypothetical protein n=1 Tax=Streptococcus anginosus TaxID=1328 RepID=UPI001246ED46|nr:hypothetical protein [Streptococcus anginosus]KAA9293498.1 hypothetical protein F6I05_04060 [Streptococcus anginosus]